MNSWVLHAVKVVHHMKFRTHRFLSSYTAVGLFVVGCCVLLHLCEGMKKGSTPIYQYKQPTDFLFLYFDTLLFRAKNFPVICTKRISNGSFRLPASTDCAPDVRFLHFFLLFSLKRKTKQSTPADCLSDL